MSIKPVIIAGGSGTRLWPLSRVGHPKQFLAIDGQLTMLQLTMERLKKLETQSPVVICNEDHRFFVAGQLSEVNQLSEIILEPYPRNTAPAIALAALLADDDPLLLVLAADHLIQDVSSFASVVTNALPLANAGKIVTFGVVPDEANTGYGYIEKGQELGPGFAVKKFIEKPSKDVAEKYLKSGKHLWNSGMFLFKASRFIEELSKFHPEIVSICEASINNIEADLDFFRVDKKRFLDCPSISIDFAVMEKTSDAVVVPMDIGWSDIGSWSSLWDASQKDTNGNVSSGDVMLFETSNSLVRADDKLVTTLGVKNLVVAATKDAVLIADKDFAQDTQIIVKKLMEDNRTEWNLNREVYRPWGKYDSVDRGERYQVKRITVKPGSKLSVQKHYHRSEHWVVVSGCAKVTKGDDTFIVNENESIYIPAGEVHALENPGKVELQLIEVQTGSYLGEDDIIRLEDIYGRA